MRNPFRAAVVATFLLAIPAAAQEAGDKRAGQTYVNANCASCHAVGSNETVSPNFAAPSFDSVAATPGMTGYAIAAWLRTPHPSMPNFIIPPDDQVNIIAYILSLRPTPVQ